MKNSLSLWAGVAARTFALASTVLVFVGCFEPKMNNKRTPGGSSPGISEIRDDSTVLIASDATPKLRLPPSDFKYAKALYVLEVGKDFVSDVPTNAGGEIVSYSVIPQLPEGLTLDTRTGLIAGVISKELPESPFSIRGINSMGRVSISISFKVVPATFGVITDFIYVDIVGEKGKLFTVPTPTYTGGPVSSFSVSTADASPALPAGLLIDSNTGSIYGTPTEVVLNPTTVTIAAAYKGGSTYGDGATLAQVSIQIKDTPPAGLVYSPTEMKCFLGDACKLAAPKSSGGTITKFSLVGAPNFLTIDAATGALSVDSKTEQKGDFSFQVKAENSTSDSTSVSVALTVTDKPTFAYNQIIGILGTALTPISPVITGVALSGFSEAQGSSLPAGLKIDAVTGAISGTPTVVGLIEVSVALQANFAGGTAPATATAKFIIKDKAPEVSYGPQTITCNLGDYCAALSPPVSTGGAVTSYEFVLGGQSNVPSFLNINTATGILSLNLNTETIGTYPFTIKATNLTKTVSVPLILVIIDPIRNLAYPFSGMILQKNSLAMTNTPTWKGPGATFDVNPKLPAGLGLDPLTGVIQGIPTAYAPKQDYVISAVNPDNTAGAAKATLSIFVANTVSQPASVSRDLRRRYHSASLLRDGRVLIAGGLDCNGAPLNTVEIFDPATGFFQSLSHPLTTARSHHSSSLMADGRVLIAGGETAPNNALATLETIDTSNGDIAAAGGFKTGGRTSPVAIRLSNGKVIFGGGTSTPALELVDPARKIFTAIGVPSNTDLSDAKGTMLASGKVLFAGILSPTASLIFDPTDNSIVKIAPPSVPTKLHTVTGLPDGTALLVGGSAVNGVVVNLTKIFSPSNSSFAAGPALISARAQHTASLMLDGTVTIAGGVDATGAALDSVEQFKNAAFSQKAALSSPRVGHTSTLLTSGGLFIYGGEACGATPPPAGEVLAPAAFVVNPNIFIPLIFP